MLLDQPSELLLSQLLLLDDNSISQLKLVNKKIYNFIKKNESYIYKKKLEQEYGEWVSNPLVLNYCLQYNINIYELKKEHAFKNILRKMIYSDARVFRFLIKYIHKINSIDVYGNTILMSLITNLHSQMDMIENHLIENHLIEKIHILLDKNPDISIQNKYKQTALIYACKHCKNLDIIRNIIELGGDLYQRDSYGWNAIMYAVVYNNENIINYIKSISKISEYDIIEILLFKKDQLIYINSNLEYTISESNDLSETSFLEIDEELDLEDYYQTKFLRNTPPINKKETILNYTKNYQKSEIAFDKIPLFISNEENIISWIERTFYLIGTQESESLKIHLIMKIYNTILSNFNVIFNLNPELVKNFLCTLYDYTGQNLRKDNIYIDYWSYWVYYSYSVLYYYYSEYSEV
jgi:ankyrin repeat protein